MATQGLQTSFSGSANIGSHKGRTHYISLIPDWICSQEQTSQPRGKLALAVEADEEGRKAGHREARFLGLFLHPEAKNLGFGRFLWDYFSYLLLVMMIQY